MSKAVLNSIQLVLLHFRKTNLASKANFSRVEGIEPTITIRDIQS